MATSLGLGPVLGNSNTELKRPFRWMLEIGSSGNSQDGIVDVVGNSVNVLPPLSGNRPSLSFREIEVEHVSETIYMPGKAQWKPMKVQVYDIAQRLKNNIVFDWIVRYYNAQKASYNYSSMNNVSNFKKNALLSIYSGNGCCLESVALENAWPRDIEFGELDMANSGILTITMELRFDRAYVTTYQQGNNYVNTGISCLDYGTGSCD